MGLRRRRVIQPAGVVRRPGRRSKYERSGGRKDDHCGIVLTRYTIIITKACLAHDFHTWDHCGLHLQETHVNTFTNKQPKGIRSRSLLGCNGVHVSDEKRLRVQFTRSGVLTGSTNKNGLAITWWLMWLVDH